MSKTATYAQEAEGNTSLHLACNEDRVEEASFLKIWSQGNEMDYRSALFHLINTLLRTAVLPITHQHNHDVGSEVDVFCSLSATCELPGVWFISARDISGRPKVGLIHSLDSNEDIGAISKTTIFQLKLKSFLRVGLLGDEVGSVHLDGGRDAGPENWRDSLAKSCIDRYRAGEARCVRIHYWGHCNWRHFGTCSPGGDGQSKVKYL
ncbi:hypothetical protein U0070_027006 [Myodes glareolus]|uniref:Uncharacterized protein n=1 Tax=Myodes glareolus TaxID=447135 RepID=A0AAW0IJP3_MYOGA